jgi:hypothetical protein
VSFGQNHIIYIQIAEVSHNFVYAIDSKHHRPSHLQAIKCLDLTHPYSAPGAQPRIGALGLSETLSRLPICMVRRPTARRNSLTKYSMRKCIPPLVGCSPVHDDDPRVLILLSPTVTNRPLAGAGSPARRLTLLSSCPFLSRLG